MSIKALECKVCSDPYDENIRIPHILACGHTFCRICLSSLFKTSSFVCPDCRSKIEFKNVIDIPIVYCLFDLMDRSGKDAKSSSVVPIDETVAGNMIEDACGIHDGKIFDRWCKTCEKWICSTCMFNEHQEPPKGKCLSLPKLEALMRKKTVQWNLKRTIMCQLENNTQQFDQNYERLKELELKSEQKISKLLNELDIEKKNHSQSIEESIRMSSRMTEIRSIEASITNAASELDKVQIISDYSKAEAKLLNFFAKAAEIQKLADIIRDNMSKADNKEKTTSIAAVSENMTGTEKNNKPFGKRRLANHHTVSDPVRTYEEDNDNWDLTPDEEDAIVARTKEELSETHEFHLDDCLNYLKVGMKVIVDDDITKRFTAEELQSWNLLTRTNLNYEFISVRLTIFWVLGCFVRYCILLPLRVVILGIGIFAIVLATYVVGSLPDNDFKKTMNKKVSMFCFDFLSGSISLKCVYHNQENVPVKGICVANHTTPIDVLVLACDNAYDMVGQRHGGLLAIFQRALSRASAHIWFERSETKDRYAVAKKLREHVEDPDKLPILIFPEGTCINNTSVMQFKKGTFEVGGVIYPVAIKYDARFGDAFWNSSKYGMLVYLYMMMTSWAIVCDVWYLPPMVRKEHETAIDFANRVKAEIVKQGGLVDLVWDGGLKRSAPKKEWREQYQQEFRRRLRIHSSNSISQLNNVKPQVESTTTVPQHQEQQIKKE